MNISFNGEIITIQSKSNHLIFFDLQYIDFFQDNKERFLPLIIGHQNNFIKIVKRLEKELFADIKFVNTDYIIGLIEIKNLKTISINPKEIKSISYSDAIFAVTDNKSNVIFQMETSYMIILDFELLAYFIEKVNTLDLVDALDRKKMDYLETLGKLTDNRFGIISAIDVRKGFPFCGSGTYQITNDAIDIQYLQ